MTLQELSLSDLEVLETRLWGTHYGAIDKIRDGQTEYQNIADNIESKLSEIKAEINVRVERFLND